MMRPFFSALGLLALLPTLFFLIPGGVSGDSENRQERRLDRDRPGSETRVALVIGNGAYQFTGVLPNPAGDAREMARALREVGFDVLLETDCSKERMERLMDEFGERLRRAGTRSVGLFYYAGHGVQVKGANYLIPVDARAQTESDLKYRAVDVDFLLGKMEDAQSGVNIVILDACRDNPFGRSFRSSQGGLAQVTAPRGTLIAYATSPGKTATDSGVYREALARAIRKPGLNILDVFQEVGAEVDSRTNGAQTPWQSSSLIGRFYFRAVSGSETTATTGEPVTKPAPPSRPPQPKPGTTMPGAAGIDLVFIPAGEFRMGATEAESEAAFRNTKRYLPSAQPDWYSNEQPDHRVVISEPFWMGKYEVTQAQWTQVMGSNPSSFGDCPRCPVDNVSWDDCREFIRRLNAIGKGNVYALPTEAEWEYACRAGTTTPFSFGATVTPNQANYHGGYPYGNTPKSRPLSQTVPVGSLNSPNPWGLHDMHGNVFEWCADWFGENYYRDSPTNDPPGPGSGERRVCRGGSWSGSAETCRSAHRGAGDPARRDSLAGLRVVMRSAKK